MEKKIINEISKFMYILFSFPFPGYEIDAKFL